MNINSTDASSATQFTIQNTTNNTKEANTNINAGEAIAAQQIASYAQPATNDTKEEVNEKNVSDAIAKANKAIAGNDRKFEYSMHEKTKTIMVKVVDTKTNQVIQEMPPEKILNLVANLMQLAGLIVDERR